MLSVTNTIRSISGERIADVVKKNRYCMVHKDFPNKLYCFSTPVFRKDNGNMVGEYFTYKDQCYTFRGSDGLIRIFRDAIHFIRNSEIVKLYFSKAQEFVLSSGGKVLRSKDLMICPTFNGLVVKALFGGCSQISFKVNTEAKTTLQNNSKYLALMKSEFEPLFTLNAMYAEDKYGRTFYNASLSVNKNSDATYQLTIDSKAEAYRVVYEMNLYEPKLLQDTTVESRRPQENNVYGSTAFLGKSPDCDAQFLYSRIDMSKIAGIEKSAIEGIKLYVPYYMISESQFRLEAPVKRFCSFGSNWNNRIPSTDLHIQSNIKNEYLVFDLSSYLLSPNGKIKANEGIVIRSGSAEERFSIIATADNYFSPQILEIQSKEKK